MEHDVDDELADEIDVVFISAYLKHFQKCVVFFLVYKFYVITSGMKRMCFLRFVFN